LCGTIPRRLEKHPNHNYGGIVIGEGKWFEFGCTEEYKIEQPINREQVFKLVNGALD